MADTNGKLTVGDCRMGDRVMLPVHGRSRFLVGDRGHPMLGPEYVELVCEYASPEAQVWRGLRVWTPECLRCYRWSERNRREVREATQHHGRGSS